MRRGRGFFIAGGACAALAAVIRFALVGYGTTALCLCALAACLCVYGLLRRSGTRAAARLTVIFSALLAAGLGLFLAMEIPIVLDARSDADTDADYIIVMGAAVHGDTPSLSMVERTDAALLWLREHPAGVAVVSGGQGGGEDMTEARAMADYLVGHGISADRVLLEPEATSSYENIALSLRVIEAHGGEPAGRVALCSSEYHLHRLRYIASALGCEPVCVAARTGHVSLRVNYFIREAFAMWKYDLFGMD